MQKCSTGLNQATKYTSKWMNNIWGMYNKDSVHNFKSVQGDINAASGFSGQEYASQQNFKQDQDHCGK